jgi:hypothetical protein
MIPPASQGLLMAFRGEIVLPHLPYVTLVVLQLRFGLRFAMDDNAFNSMEFEISLNVGVNVPHHFHSRSWVRFFQ